ncbi:MAG: uroporphyrinogen-III synthase [Chitinophagaceae bacterium]|jgi:uroporphyrinogen-III synthase|nr:uroporphyrinogen-III synthase [Chitinophagaceae bacterium]
MQPNNISILSTQKMNDMLLQKAKEKNIVVDVLPFIRIESLVDTALSQEIKRLGAAQLNVVFTSVNAVEATIKNFDKMPDWKIACIGGATRQAVASFLGEDKIATTALNAKQLAQKIIDKKNIQSVVFFCGKRRLDLLPETLIKSGIEVREINVYNTINTPHKIDKLYDGILFFSPSAVQSFFSLNKLNPQTIIFSIGTTTTAAIEACCANRVITCKLPEKEQIIELVIAYFA